MQKLRKLDDCTENAKMNKKLREVKARYFADLLQQPGVVCVGLGTDYLRIYFDATVEGAKEHSLPKALDGIAVRLIPYP
jgi:hypothetical protein